MKNTTRQALRHRRRHLSSDFVDHASQLVCEQVLQLPGLRAACHIGLYLPHENEIDTRSIIHHLHEMGKQCYLPITLVNSKVLQYYCYHPGSGLKQNHHGILEPEISENDHYPVEKLDFIIMPLVGFDASGNRLGRGAGYFDVTLAFLQATGKDAQRLNHKDTKQPMCVALAYEFQKLPKINAETWDIPMDIIVTEANTYYR